VPQVEVAFDIDANGIVNVTAKDMATGKEQKITITGSSGLAKDEVDRMVKDAQGHEAEDKAKRDEIEARNQAEAQAYQTEKAAKAQAAQSQAPDVKDGEVKDAEVVDVA